MRYGWTFLVLASLVFSGCGKENEDHDNGHEEHEAGGTIDVPAHYADAVAACETLSKKIGALIADGHLDDVHAAAAGIQKIAEKLPTIAQKDLPASMLRDVNIKSKELAGMFAEMDEAGDSGNAAETKRLHAHMQELIAGLRAHASHAKKSGHDGD